MSLISTSERQDIEDYLNLYCIEACMDEVLNEIVEKRPVNPYMAIAAGMEAKTMAEIISINLVPILTNCGSAGVQAVIETNIAKFTGDACYPPVAPDGEEDLFRDFTVVLGLVQEVLLKKDPRNMAGIDDVIATIEGITQPIKLALSIACCRAGARHKGQSVYRYISDLYGAGDLAIPMPVISVLSRVITGTPFTQDITLTAVMASSVESALETLLRSASAIRLKLDETKVAYTLSTMGSAQVSFNTLDEAVTLVYQCLKAAALPGSACHIGIDLHSDSVFVPDSGTYFIDGPNGAAKTGTQLAAYLGGIFVASEVITFEDALSGSDIAGAKQLKHKIASATHDKKSEFSSDRLPYFAKGVGGVADCNAQVVADVRVTTAEELRAIVSMEAEDSVTNTLKVQLQKAETVSRAIELCRAARSAGWALILGCSEDGIECNDTFMADFAVAVGAGQFSAGGVLSGEFFGKYNRILEISREDPSIPFVSKSFRR